MRYMVASKRALNVLREREISDKAVQKIDYQLSYKSTRSNKFHSYQMHNTPPPESLSFRVATIHFRHGMNTEHKQLLTCERNIALDFFPFTINMLL